MGIKAKKFRAEAMNLICFVRGLAPLMRRGISKGEAARCPFGQDKRRVLTESEHTSGGSF
jgi:hypothetical protein